MNESANPQARPANYVPRSVLWLRRKAPSTSSQRWKARAHLRVDGEDMCGLTARPPGTHTGWAPLHDLEIVPVAELDPGGLPYGFACASCKKFFVALALEKYPATWGIE